MEVKTPLSDEESRQLAERYLAGDKHAIDKLILANQGFVISIARQYQGKGVDLDDLVSEGNIAMMMCAPKWDPQKEPRFVKYAVWHIRKAMEQTIEKMGSVIRVPSSSPNSQLHSSKASQTYKVRSMDAPLRPGHSRSLGETMPQRGTKNISDEANDGTLTIGLEDGLQNLNARELQVIINYYGIGTPHLTMAEIGEMMNLKRERVRQIRKKAERRLRKPLRNYN